MIRYEYVYMRDEQKQISPLLFRLFFLRITFAEWLKPSIE